MPAAAARRVHPSGARQEQSDGKRGKASAVALSQQPLEHRILLTATLCLLAFGAVMVYSASSATTLLGGAATAAATWSSSSSTGRSAWS